MAEYHYDRAFHNYTARISRASAERVILIMKSLFRIESVLDVGCASGTWLSAWHDSGVEDYLGIDITPGDAQTLVIGPDHFRVHDLAQRFQLNRRYDLVQCLEVAEHLPPERSIGFVSDLAAHGPVILFSAAAPGQGGEHHVNERPYAYWRDLFAAEGFALLDCVRPLLAPRRDVAAWYRYNTLLFVHESYIDSLPPFLQWFRIEKDAPVPDVSPFLYKIRKTMIQRLPFTLRQILAKAKARSGPGES